MGKVIIKTEITKDGQLFITAETQIESYALKQFYQTNFDDFEKRLRGENIFFDWTVHPIPCSYAHHVNPCIVCGGTGNSTAMNTCCPNCNGTGNVWV